MNEPLFLTLVEAKLSRPHNCHLWRTNRWWCFAKDNFTLLLCPTTNLLYITENGNATDFLTVDVNLNGGVIEGNTSFKRFWDLMETTIRVIPIDGLCTDYDLVHTHVIWLVYQYSYYANHLSAGTNYLLSYNKVSNTRGRWQWDGVGIDWDPDHQDQNHNS